MRAAEGLKNLGGGEASRDRRSSGGTGFASNSPKLHTMIPQALINSSLVPSLFCVTAIYFGHNYWTIGKSAVYD